MARVGIVFFLLVSACDENSAPECLQGVRSDACRMGKTEDCRLEFNNCNDHRLRAVECEQRDDGAMACVCEGWQTTRETKSIQPQVLHTLTFDEAVDFIGKQCSGFTYTGKEREWARE